MRVAGFFAAISERALRDRGAMTFVDGYLHGVPRSGDSITKAEQLHADFCAHVLSCSDCALFRQYGKLSNLCEVGDKLIRASLAEAVQEERNKQ